MSIKAYLEHRGFTIIQDGLRYITNSPIKLHLTGEVDRTPSFTIYPNNTFKCWSTGHSGGLMRLRQLLNDHEDLQLPEFVPPTTQPKRQSHWRGVVPPKYLDITEEERRAIIEYGKSRRITRGFTPGCYFNSKYERRPSLMFIHTDEEGLICGAKFRAIDPPQEERRFVMRGRPGFYVLTNRVDSFIPSKLFLIESETSANSLWEICRETNRNVVVASHGSVQNIPRNLPDFGTINSNLVLDFDGNDELYQSRVRKYRHLGIKPLKLKLPKGVDINTLYCNSEHYLIENLL